MGASAKLAPLPPKGSRSPSPPPFNDILSYLYAPACEELPVRIPASEDFSCLIGVVLVKAILRIVAILGNGLSIPTVIESYSHTVDAESGVVYMYGDFNVPGIEQTRHLWELNLNTHEWVNRTNDFKPAGDFKLQPGAPSGLPFLAGSCMSLAVIDSKKLLFIAGAHDTIPKDTSESPINETLILALDLNGKVFWDISPRNGPIQPRMDAAMAVIDSHLYLFGGTNIVDEGQEYSLLNTYCIARFLATTSEAFWSWVVKDKPYGRGVPSLGYTIGLQPVYRGAKLVLFPGITERTQIVIKKGAIVFFDTKEWSFSVQRSMPGTFPMGCFRYSYGSPGSPDAAGYTNERVYLATWTTNPLNASDDAVWDFEVWQYALPPEPNFAPLRVTKAINELDIDPEEFFVVGNRLVVIGVQTLKNHDVPAKATRPRILSHT